jgi:hypothetical protein
VEHVLGLNFVSTYFLRFSSRRLHFLYRDDSRRLAGRLEKKQSTNAALAFASRGSLGSLELCKRYAVLVQKKETNTVCRRNKQAERLANQ